jgi:hypothetical protein
MASVYGEQAAQGLEDERWLADVGHHDWIVLRKDDAIRRRPSERDVLATAKVRAFCLTNANSAPPSSQPGSWATSSASNARPRSPAPTSTASDTGYWREQQIDEVVNMGIQVLIPPDAGKHERPRRGWTGGRYAFMRTVLAGDLGGGLYRKRKAMVEPVFAQAKHNRRIDQFFSGEADPPHDRSGG